MEETIELQRDHFTELAAWDNVSEVPPVSWGSESLGRPQAVEIVTSLCTEGAIELWKLLFLI